jgi:DNA-binding FrmR family transcriptional regulator
MGVLALDTTSARTKAKVNRFNRIAGQVQGIARMVGDGRYCIDVLQQIQSVKTALARAEGEVLRDHAANCVAHAINSGDVVEQRKKVDELVDLFDRSRR